MESIGDRIKSLRGKTSVEELANLLVIHPQTLYKYEKGTREPNLEFIQSLVKIYSCSADWLIFGTGHIYKDKNPNQPLPDQGIVWIPMVEAVLSAGHGSLETSGESERKYAFRYDFISRKGNPDNMVLMRVSGTSMEPDILDGDTVLIDQSKKTITAGKIFAVGFDEQIYLKKIDSLPGKIILKSTNPEYPPLELDSRGQLADSFRIIGRVLWCSREYL